MEQKGRDVKIEVKVDDDVASGIFSNFTNISHSPEEFIVDFIFVHPTPPPGFGKLKSRLILTPGHAKRLFMALRDNIAEYESRYGDIDIQKSIEQIGNIQ